MDDFEKLYWEEPKKKKVKLTNKEIYKRLFWIHFNAVQLPILTFLTRFYPFSLLWRDRCYHYHFKEIEDADRLINKFAAEKNYYLRLNCFERSHQILNLVSTLIPLNKKAKKDELLEHLGKRTEKENIFIHPLENNQIKITFARKNNT